MSERKKYVVDGRVEREKIAMDIKYRVITRSDLDALVSDPKICAAFIGTGFSDKKPKSQWTKEYLDELSYAVVAEGFNAEYLYYLNDVAEYVSNKKGNTRIIVSAAILAAAVAVFIFVIVK